MTSRDALALGTESRPPVLFQGSYAQWKQRFLDFVDRHNLCDEIMESLTIGPVKYCVPETDTPLLFSQMSAIQKNRVKGDKLARSFLLLAVTDDIFTNVDSYKSGKDIWDEIASQMQGSSITTRTKMANVLTKYESFRQAEGELLADTYNRFCNLLNEVRKNQLQKTTMEINIKFLKNLQPAWERHAMSIIENRDLETEDIHHVFETLSLNQDRVLRKQQGTIQEVQPAPPASDNLALVAARRIPPVPDQQQLNEFTEAEDDLFHEIDNDQNIDDADKEMLKAMSFFSRAIQRKYYRKPTNNNQRASSSSSATKRLEYPG